MKVEEDFKVIEHYLCIKMPREVDHHNAGNIAEAADEMICKSEVRNLIFDFSDTEFMDSSGIAVVVRTARKCAAYGGRLSVSNTPSQAKKVLLTAGIHRLVEIR